MVAKRRIYHVAVFAAVVLALVLVLAIVDQVALAVIVGLAGIILIGAAIPFIAIEQDERGP